ncbi:hypothetical protein RCL1_005178 [Eukaryota sp. TZLM3-RCL]
MRLSVETLVSNYEQYLNESITVRVRVHNVRGKGSAAFLVLRDGIDFIQACAFASETTPKPLVKALQKLSRESILDVTGVLSPVEEEIHTATLKKAELHIQSYNVVVQPNPRLVFTVEDAMHKEENEEEDKVLVSQNTRLNARALDLRTPANHAIFELQSHTCRLFREFLANNKFMEIHTPKLIAGSSEGGAAVFRLKYFDRDACLAQSPQLYKQMAVASGFSRVFEIGPVFRAENSFTHRHLCEFVGLDIEMEIFDHYHEVLDMLENLFAYIFNGLHEQCGNLIETVRSQYHSEPLQLKWPAVRITFAEGVQMLRDAGVDVGDFDDLSTVNEKLLGRLVKEKFQTDFFILDRFPSAIRPFYTMADPQDPNYSYSYDLFLRGEEITSGAQRVHDAETVSRRAAECGIDVATLKYYIEAFEYGAPPHGGAGIGLERLVMLFLGLNNIRKTSMYVRDPQRIFP